ncbi:MAG: DUF4314 domain-containing protein [Erysipelotrichaceae bacterium]|nr:DUF4314 domain-containing protein [Erysipelotrichaceae bacterium]
MIISKSTASEFAKGTSLNCLKPEVGKWLKIISMKEEPQYTGRIGRIEHIDDAGQIHGTWGGCAVIPHEDSFYLAESESELRDV